MKQVAPALVLLLLALLCGCQAPGAPASSDAGMQGETESTYEFYKPLIAAEGTVEVEPLALPSEINGRKVALSRLLDETRLLLLLYKENPLPVVEEAGVYNLDDGEYRSAFSIAQDKTVSIEWTANQRVVYKLTDTVSGTVSLHCHDLQTGEENRIYEFSSGYAASSASRNAIVGRDGRIYFDDAVCDGAQLVGVRLLEYDLKTRALRQYQDNAQNPMLLNGALAYICKEPDTGRYFVATSGEEEEIYLDERISALTSSGDALYSINNESTDPQTMRTVWSLNALPQEELLVSSNVIDRLVANEKVVGWQNFSPERPILYLRARDSFVVLLDDEIGYHSYLLGDGGGILVSSHEDATTAYYQFRVE